MNKEQALGILVQLIKQSKLTEDERSACYQAIKLLAELDKKEEQPVA